jgi:jumonji domain-containing protein 7
VPWIPVDPSAPDLVLYPRFKYARPLIATLEAGGGLSLFTFLDNAANHQFILDMLYLPALWYHRVSQDVGPDTIGGGELKLAIAVNWWTEMNLDGPLQSLATLLRRMTLQLDGVTENDSDDDDSV